MQLEISQLRPRISETEQKWSKSMVSGSETMDFDQFGWFWQACPARAGITPQKKAKRTKSGQNQWFRVPKPWILTTLGGSGKLVQPGPELHPRISETDQKWSKSMVSGSETMDFDYFECLW